MIKRDCLGARKTSRVRACLRFCLCFLACVGPGSTTGTAKEQPLTAILVYRGPSGWLWMQASDVVLNGKVEIRDCGGATTIDKSAYAKLAKITLSPPASLEVLDDGSLKYVREDADRCAVPGNFRFEKSASLKPGELTERSKLDGRPIGASGDALPPLKPGLLIVFVPAPDSEYGEYLVASRAGEISYWDNYLAKFPKGAHVAEGLKIFAQVLLKQGKQHLEQFKKSQSSGTPGYEDLQTAAQLSARATTILPSDPAVKNFAGDVTGSIEGVVKIGDSELELYRRAVANHTSGYVHLQTATELLGHLTQVDPKNSTVDKYRADVHEQRDAYESAVHAGQSAIEGHRFDEGVNAIATYKAFSPEDQRIAAIIDAAYTYHLNQGESLASSNDWDKAVEEFGLAKNIKPTAAATSSLENAKKEREKQRDKAAADAALQQSNGYAAQNDFIGAYEILANLPTQQRALVQPAITELVPSYVKSASETAQQLHKAHDPIRGLADEKAIERAYGYLDRAYSLDGQPSLRERRDDLGEKLSEYYLTQAKRYFDKPLGSGVCLGVSYLDKAMPYKATNMEALRDELMKESATYQIRSKLSIRVEFRDQTSRRDSIGFAEQLADAIATGLESSGLPVKIIRPGDNPAVEANFHLIGDVVDHRKNTTTNSVSRDSTYRASEELLPNDQWNAANREYEAAKLELESARSVLQGASARGKKKEMSDAQKQVSQAEQKVKNALAKEDSIPKSTVHDIIKPYSYTEKTIQLSALVELRFRIVDAYGQPVETSEQIKRTNSQNLTSLENVKPEDTNNVKMEGSVPDENEFLIDVENSARDALIKEARESVQRLPQKIFERAQQKEREGDLDGAGENYILYLNSVPPNSMPERTQAEVFLLDQFNIRRKIGVAN